MTRLALALSLLLVLPATASAGGWTTVGLSQPPVGVSAGDKWDATMTILQHGRTPLEGQQPVVAITNGTTTKTFTATPADRPGVYRASVVFPTDGRWRVTVDHGWGVTHRFAPIEVGDRAPAATGGGGGAPDWLPAAGIALAVGLLAALATVLVGRRRTAAAP